MWPPANISSSSAARPIISAAAAAAPNSPPIRKACSPRRRSRSCCRPRRRPSRSAPSASSSRRGRRRRRFAGREEGRQDRRAGGRLVQGAREVQGLSLDDGRAHGWSAGVHPARVRRHLDGRSTVEATPSHTGARRVSRPCARSILWRVGRASRRTRSSHEHRSQAALTFALDGHFRYR